MPFLIVLLAILLVILYMLGVAYTQTRARLSASEAANKLQDEQITELEAQVAKTDEQVRAEILIPYLERHEADRQSWLQQLQNAHRRGYRLPIGKDIRVVTTPLGIFAIRAAQGYYVNAAIFVYFPLGFGFSTELAQAFHQATDGNFVMDPAPGPSSGGDEYADAIITAGLNYDAFRLGEQGYFKNSPPPDLDETAAVLEQIIIYPRGVTASA